MRVLHIVNDAETGGAQTLIEALALNRESGDLIFLIVVLGRGALSPRFESSLDEVIYLNASKRTFVPFFLAARIARHARRLRVDIVHSHLFQSDFLAFLASFAPRRSYGLVSTVHTSENGGKRRLSKALGLALPYISARFDATIACTRASAQYMSDARYRSDILETIFNGVRVPEAIAPSRRTFAFLSLARWHPMKDHRTLINAFALAHQRDPRLRLICAGLNVDESNTQLIDIIREFDVSGKVQLLGSAQSVLPLLRKTDALVLSSSRGEALPMAGLESLASSTPVITTDVGDCALLTVERATLVPPRDPIALAEAMIWFAAISDHQFGVMQEASHELARRIFDISFTSDQYRSLYSRVVQSRALTEVDE